MDTMVKGYMIQYASHFILEEKVLRASMPASLVARAEQNTKSLQPNQWHPREQLLELWHGIAASQPDEASARATLVRCGGRIGAFAAGSFLKLLFKVLTPRMFAYKFPDLWKRDSQGGRIEVEAVEPNALTLVFKEVEGFDHICPISQGWIGFVLQSMGLKQLRTDSGPWSLAQPGPPEVRFKAEWQ